MKYESACEKAMIVPKQVMPPSLDRNSEMKSAKLNLLASIRIELFIMIIYLVLQIVIFLFKEIENDHARSGALIESLITLISIAYLIAFLIVIARYFPAGILVFAWLTLIQLIGGSFLFIFAIMGIIVSLTLIQSVGAGIIVDIVYTTIGIAIIVISVSIIIHSLNILKLMKK